MKTSKLTLRPFMPYSEVKGSGLKPLPNAKPEEYATLTYNNVTIRLDYTILRHLELNCSNNRVCSICLLGLNEILTEMNFVHDGLDKPREEVWFRDNPKKCSITHPWSPLANGSDNYKNVVDGTRTMVWEKLEDK